MEVIRDRELHEECGVFGIYGVPNAASLTYYGLHALQHRGQEGAGIVSVDESGTFRRIKGGGLVTEVFDEAKLATLKGSTAIGHVRYTTAGGGGMENVQPFLFRHNTGDFALAHNGVLTNDRLLRRQEKLPVSKIETDSFIIVQLLEQAGSIGFQTLRAASERLAGSFTYTVLDGGGRLYIVRGNNPFCLYHWPEQGLYLYASTQAVLDAAVFKIRKLLSESVQKIPVEEGEILRLSPDGSRASETFSMKKLYQFQLCQSPYYGSCWPDVQDNTGYAEELRRMAPAFGFSAKDVDTLLRGGMLPEEIEEYLYCGGEV